MEVTFLDVLKNLGPFLLFVIVVIAVVYICVKYRGSKIVKPEDEKNELVLYSCCKCGLVFWDYYTPGEKKTCAYCWSKE